MTRSDVTCCSFDFGRAGARSGLRRPLYPAAINTRVFLLTNEGTHTVNIDHSLTDNEADDETDEYETTASSRSQLTESIRCEQIHSSVSTW